MTQEPFDLGVGIPCLDFANTVDWHAGPQPADRLRDYGDLLAWGEAAGLLSAGRRGDLARAAAADPAAAAAAFGRAVALREAIYRIFAALAAGQPASSESEDLAILNDALGPALAHLQIAPGAAGFTWAWRAGPADLDQVAWPVARSAGELLASDQLDRVRQCEDDRGCGYLFVDTSRNRSRRWCSMETCGNRAKARRHYRRSKKEGPDPEDPA